MLELKSSDLKKDEIQALVIPVCKDKDIHDDPIISSFVKKALALEEFKGDKDEEIIFYNPPEIKSKRVIFLGLGQHKKIDPEPLRQLAGRAVKKCIKKDLTQVLIAVPSAQKIKLEMPAVLEAMLEGGFLGNHLFDKYKKKKSISL